MNLSLPRFLMIGVFILGVATSAAPQAMLEGNAQRSRVFATQSVDTPPQGLLWEVEKLFNLNLSLTRRAATIFYVSPNGHGFTPPLISGGMIFFAIHQGDSYLFVMDAATGKKIFLLKFANTGMSGPAALGSVVFFGTGKGQVNAYDASTQKLKWSFEEKDVAFTVADPVIVDGVVYVRGAGRGVYALAADTGALLWHYKIDKWVVGHAVQGEDVIVLNETSLIALDRKTGAKKWQSSVGRAFWGPSILDDQIFVRHFDGEVRAYALKDGALRWKAKKNGGTATKMALFNGLVIYGEEFGNLVALDARTGLEKWRFKTQKFCHHPLVAGSIAYARCDDNLYALNAESGSLKWSIDTKKSGITPIIADGVMYSLHTNGLLQAFR